MRLVFFLFAAGLIMAAICGLALAWDGGYTAFVLLDTQAPYASYGRFTDLVLRLPLILSSQITTIPLIWGTVFGLAYALVPLLSLLASWLIVRDEAPALFVWAAIVIGLVTFPGQACLVCQGVGAVQLFVPVLLAVLIGMPRAKIPLAALFGLGVAFFHPSAIPLFAFGAVVALVFGVRYGARRRNLWASMLCLALAGAVVLVRFQAANNSYELGQLSLAVIQAQVRQALDGLPLAALICAGLVALALLVQPYLVKHLAGDSRLPNLRYLQFGILGAIAVAGALLVFWAIDPGRWALAINYRDLALFVALPFLALAALDAFAHLPPRGDELELVGLDRRRVSQAIAIVFCTAFSVQGLAWQSLGNQLQVAMRASPGACLSADSIPWIAGTPVDHWALTAWSLVLQGRTPDKVVMPGDGCKTANFQDGLPLAIFDPGDWDLRDWGSGWFQLQALGAQLVAAQSTPPSCKYSFNSGWYAIEQKGADWWRWTGGDASIQVIMAQDERATLTGVLISLSQPNHLTILENGAPVLDLNLALPGPETLPPVELNLARGANTIEFKSQNAPRRVPHDSRLLALALGDLALTNADGVALCK